MAAGSVEQERLGGVARASHTSAIPYLPRSLVGNLIVIGASDMEWSDRSTTGLTNPGSQLLIVCLPRADVRRATPLRDVGLQLCEEYTGLQHSLNTSLFSPHITDL